MSPLMFQVRVKRSEPCPTHTPLTQAALVAQARPQAPQLSRSVWRFVQLPLHSELPLGHTHAPPVEHTPPAGEVQLPLVRGTAVHAVPCPEHTIVPVPAHPPVPAELQLAPVARQTPPQSLCPLGQLD